jgi:pilus assembly protein Flp/PilA
MLARTLHRTLADVQRFRRDEHGATAIEYTLIAGFIGLVIVIAVSNVGTKLTPIFETIASAL